MMGGFFAVYAFGIYLSNPITAARGRRRGPAGVRGDRLAGDAPGVRSGFGVALSLTLTGGLILASGSLFGRDTTFRGGEIIVMLSNGLWTLYSIKAQAWFDRASQLHRAYVASLSALGWLICSALSWWRSAGRNSRSASATAGSGPS